MTAVATDIAAETWVITPEVAAELLARNDHNRPLRERHVEKLVRAMTRGEWVLNGEAIKIGEDGRLQDGQHRLAAVVKSDTTIRSVVVLGLPPVAQETVDIGARRTVADMLKLRGHPNASVLAAAARYVLTYHEHQAFSNTYASSLYTTQQLVAFVEENPDIHASIRLGKRVNEQIRGSAAVWAAIHFLASEVDCEDADVFFEHLQHGVEPVHREPIYVLRKTLLAEALKSTRRANAIMAAAWTIKALNAWRAGTEIGFVRWVRGGAQAEPFPRIVGHPANGKDE